MQNKTILFIILGLVGFTLLAVIGLSAIGLYISMKIQQSPATDTSIDSFEECVAAGYPVMESYPRQCRANGQTFVEKLSGGNNQNSEYYGSSTMDSCLDDTDCTPMGCNSEICAGINSESGISDCRFPSQPLPKDLGYSCKCVSKKCQWNK